MYYFVHNFIQLVVFVILSVTALGAMTSFAISSTRRSQGAASTNTLAAPDDLGICWNNGETLAFRRRSTERIRPIERNQGCSSRSGSKLDFRKTGVARRRLINNGGDVSSLGEQVGFSLASVTRTRGSQASAVRRDVFQLSSKKTELIVLKLSQMALGRSGRQETAQP